MSNRSVANGMKARSYAIAAGSLAIPTSASPAAIAPMRPAYDLWLECRTRQAGRDEPQGAAFLGQAAGGPRTLAGG